MLRSNNEKLRIWYGERAMNPQPLPRDPDARRSEAACAQRSGGGTPPAPQDDFATLRLDEGVARRIADVMFALCTPSRLQILACLRTGPRTVSEIVAAVGMEQSAVSHQLRVLREHSVVSVRRLGRRRQYSLRDQHVRALLEEAIAHVGERPR
jgi:DNA-binding transcriptional ArsR family regulator